MNRIFFIKIAGSMVVSLFITILATNTIFISSTPRLRPNLGQYLVEKAMVPVTFLSAAVGSVGESLSNVHLFTQNNSSSPNTQQPTASQPISSATAQSLVQSLAPIPFNNLEPGISTKEDTHTSYTLIKEQEVQWQDYSANSNGQKIIIRVPKGEQAPQNGFLKF